LKKPVKTRPANSLRPYSVNARRHGGWRLYFWSFAKINREAVYHETPKLKPHSGLSSARDRAEIPQTLPQAKLRNWSDSPVPGGGEAAAGNAPKRRKPEKTRP
jgi:hypothetical protein